MGGHLKNTVCVTRGDEAFVSQHIGDLDNPATLAFFRETIAHLTAILEVEPELVACDRHPDFMATRYADETTLPVVRVQHHHAHIAAVAAEHQLEGPILGLALDGFGLGDDGGSWGGELLHVAANKCTRLASLAPLRQPGGDKAASEPWRMGASALAAMGRNDEIAGRYGDHPGAELLARMVAQDVNCPPTSSAGRLFDAACGILGVHRVAQFEGQAPMALEAMVTQPVVLEEGWRIREDGALDFLPLLEALLDTDPVSGANLFHGTLIAGCVAWVVQMARSGRAGMEPHVALSGGCLQNKVLAEGLVNGLQAAGLAPKLPVRAPANDGGLSLGQAWVAANTALERAEPWGGRHVSGFAGKSGGD